ncbi:GlxA family transcriptional regulator [Acidicapsa dinghuensis]|uniref:GlxA family transcriptional regulator n=1 Tax=Acidicapsa dinghuensis TaxID=2218256 RepID=A0ABW1EMS5_9BACT|nr:helix-turn-helix domain-containing protein [Acidicapsa dinghuensis]
MKHWIPNRLRVVAFIVDSPVDLLNLIGLTSVFASPRIDGKPVYSTSILSAGSEREVQGADGVASIRSIPYTEHVGPIDTMVVIGGDNTVAKMSTDVAAWIHRNLARVRRVASVGSGTFMLASTGYLDGKRVTTHWHYAEKLAKQFPRLRIEKEPIFVKDGNIYSTAGVTAGIDMALALVEEDLGHASASAIARDLLLYMRRPGHEAQQSSLLVQQSKVGGTRMRDLPAWAKTHISRPLDVGTLADVVAMAPRTFARQFESRFKTTPARWVQSLRVEAVCEHLEAHELPLKAIARLTGFRDEQALRRAFRQQRSMTPKEYRERLDSIATSQLSSSDVIEAEIYQG